MFRKICFLALIFAAFGCAALAHEGEHDFRWVSCSSEGHKCVCVIGGCGEVKPGTGIEAHTGGKASCAGRAVCEVCGAKYGKRIAHDYIVTDEYAEGCDHYGTVTKVCRVCRRRVEERIPATGHYYGEWSLNGDGTHSAICKRCGFVETVQCGEYAYSTGKLYIGVCPVCGDCTENGERVEPFERVSGAWWGNEDANATPEYAEIVVFVKTLPDGKHAYAISMETCGTAMNPDARIWVTVPADFESVSGVSGVGDAVYEYEGGVLRLIIGRAGLYLISE